MAQPSLAVHSRTSAAPPNICLSHRSLLACAVALKARRQSADVSVRIILSPRFMIVVVGLPAWAFNASLKCNEGD